MDVEHVVNEIFCLYETYGESSYSEHVSITCHSLECASLAEQDGQPTEVVIGTFLHDIGHLVGKDQKLETMVSNGTILGTKDHDEVGAAYLRNFGFPKNICQLVQGHVQAKRYLVWKHPDYHSKLSDASKNTLLQQGGVMSDFEADKFEKSEQFDVILKMRKWDEQGKDSEVETPPLQNYKRLCLEYLKGTQEVAKS